MPNKTRGRGEKVKRGIAQPFFLLTASPFSPFHLFGVVSALGTGREVRARDEPHGDGAPSPVAQLVRWAIAETVDCSEIAYYMFVEAVQVFHLARLVDQASALCSKLPELLGRGGGGGLPGARVGGAFA